RPPDRKGRVANRRQDGGITAGPDIYSALLFSPKTISGSPGATEIVNWRVVIPKLSVAMWRGCTAPVKTPHRRGEASPLRSAGSSHSAPTSSRKIRMNLFELMLFYQKNNSAPQPPINGIDPNVSNISYAVFGQVSGSINQAKPKPHTAMDARKAKVRWPPKWS